MGAKLTARCSVEPIPPSFEPSKAGSRHKVSQHLDRPFYTKPYCSYYVRVSTPQECSTKSKESVKSLNEIELFAALGRSHCSCSKPSNLGQRQRTSAAGSRETQKMFSLLFKKNIVNLGFIDQPWPGLLDGGRRFA